MLSPAPTEKELQKNVRNEGTKGIIFLIFCQGFCCIDPSKGHFWSILNRVNKKNSTWRFFEDSSESSQDGRISPWLALSYLQSYHLSVAFLLCWELTENFSAFPVEAEHKVPCRGTKAVFYFYFPFSPLTVSSHKSNALGNYLFTASPSS